MTTTSYATTGIETNNAACEAWHAGERRFVTLSLRGERRGVWHASHVEDAKVAARKALAAWEPKLRMVTYTDSEFSAFVAMARYQGFDDNTITLAACLQ